MAPFKFLFGNCYFQFLWWCLLDSNQRLYDYLLSALLIELCNLSSYCLETVTCCFCGGASWIRTSDTRIFSPLLYQLSYGTVFYALNYPSLRCKCSFFF